MTLEELLEHFKTDHKIVLTMLANGMSLIYAPHLIKAGTRENQMKRKYDGILSIKIFFKIQSVCVYLEFLKSTKQ